MKPYELKSDETVIARYTIKQLVPAIVDRKNMPKPCSTELTLTNLNLIVSTLVHRRIFRDMRIETVYPLSGVKIYREEPQIKRDGTKIELYHLDGEFFFELADEKEARELTEKIMYLITGDPKLVRGLKKVIKAAEDAGKSLGLDAMALAEAVGIAVSTKGGVARKIAGAGIAVAGAVIEGHKHRSEDKTEEQ